MDIAGAAALVTGGGSGLGAATGRWLAANGAQVAVLDRNADAAARVAEEIGGVACVCDVADGHAAEQAIRRAAEAHGEARILVNCAGIGKPARIVNREGPQPLDAFEQVVRVNLTGTFNMIRLAADRMIKLDPLAGGERGVVISTSSVAAYEGQIGQAAYSASKGGIAAMTLPAAREFGRFGIRVLAIAPGLFLTPLIDELPQETRDGLAGAVPFPNRLGEPAEFAQLVGAMIVNPYLNGEVVRLDGALRMPPR